MAGRGSGIGMGAAFGGGLGTGGIGGSATSRRPAAPGQVYGPRVRGAATLQTHHWLWLLVALEVGALVVLRYLFRQYHGG